MVGSLADQGTQSLGWVGLAAQPSFRNRVFGRICPGSFQSSLTPVRLGRATKQGCLFWRRGICLLFDLFFFSSFFFFIVVCSILLSLLLIRTALGNGLGNKLIVRFVFLFNSKNSRHGVGMPLCSLRPIFIHQHSQTQAASQPLPISIGNFHCYEISTGRSYYFFFPAQSW